MRKEKPDGRKHRTTIGTSKLKKAEEKEIENNNNRNKGQKMR